MVLTSTKSFRTRELESQSLMDTRMCRLVKIRKGLPKIQVLPLRGRTRLKLRRELRTAQMREIIARSMMIKRKTWRETWSTTRGEEVESRRGGRIRRATSTLRSRTSTRLST